MSTGYGVRAGELAHRIVYRDTYGAIPEGSQIHHVCRRRNCVNPQHLVAVTPAVHNAIHGTNLAAVIAGNRAKTHCPAGHPYDEENTLVKRGHRYCRECERQRSRERYARNREREREKIRERARIRRGSSHLIGDPRDGRSREMRRIRDARVQRPARTEINTEVEK